MRKALTLIFTFIVLVASLQLTLNFIKPVKAATPYNTVQNPGFEDYNRVWADWTPITTRFISLETTAGDGAGGSDNYLNFSHNGFEVTQNFSILLGYGVPVANITDFTAYVRKKEAAIKLRVTVTYIEGGSNYTDVAIGSSGSWVQVTPGVAFMNVSRTVETVAFEKVLASPVGDYLSLDLVNMTANFSQAYTATFNATPALGPDFSINESAASINTSVILNGWFDDNFDNWTRGGTTWIVTTSSICGVETNHLGMTQGLANYVQQNFTPAIRCENIIALYWYGTVDQGATLTRLTIYYNDSSSETDTSEGISQPWSYNDFHGFAPDKYVSSIRISSNAVIGNVFYDCITLAVREYTFNDTSSYTAPQTFQINILDYPLRVTCLNESIGALNNFTNWLENGTELTTSLSFISYDSIAHGSTFTMNYSSFVMTTAASISNLEGCGDWVFVDETYYNFTATFTHPTDSTLFDVVRLRFWTPTQHGNVTNTFSYNGSEYSATYSPAIDQADRPTRLRNGAASYPSNTTLTVIWPVWFTRESLDVYLSDCVDIDLWANETSGAVTNWTQTAADYFHIYNLGGFQTTQTLSGFEESTDAYRIEGGDVFDLVAMNGSGIEVDYYYRHLQHIKLRPRIRALIGYPSFIIQYQVDYCIDPDDWVTGWAVRLVAESVTVGTEIRYNFTASWYYNGTHISSKDVSVHSFNTYGSSDNGTSAETVLWIDLWFNKENASSVVAGRVNAYEYAMKDNADLWVQWLSTNWGPERDLNKETTFYHELTAANGSRIHTGRIKMVKVKCWLYASWVDGQEGPQQVTLNDYQVFDVTLGDTQQPFAGVTTPTFEETISPVMPMGGWTGTLWTGLMRLGTIISENILWGGLNLLPTFIAAMDTIAAAFGFPNAFTNLLTWITNSWNWLTTGVGYLISLITPFFTLVASFMSKFITLVATAATYWAQIFTGIWNLLDGGLTGGFSIWDNMGLTSWLTLAVILFPIYLLMVWEEEGIDAAVRQARLPIDAFLMLANIFLRIAQFVINLIGRFIESIPVVE